MLKSTGGNFSPSEFKKFAFAIFLKIYLSLAVLSFCCYTGLSLVAASGGCSLAAVHELLIAVTSTAAEHGLQGARASAAVAPRLRSTKLSVLVGYGLSCSTVCGIFLDQGLDPCLLHWQMDSSPLSTREAPFARLLKQLPMS